MSIFSSIRHIIVLVIISLSCIQNAQAGFYPEAKDDLEAVQFFARSYFKPGTDTAIMEFRVWFKHPPEKVFGILADTNKLSSRLENFNASRSLTKIVANQVQEKKPNKPDEAEKIIAETTVGSFHGRHKGHNWSCYAYLKFNFPWPLTDRWIVQKARIDESNWKQGEYKYEYKMMAGNFEQMEGYWKLKPVEGHEGWTEWYGHYESNAGISVPKFITKKAMKAGLKKDVEAYRKVLAR